MLCATVYSLLSSLKKKKKSRGPPPVSSVVFLRATYTCRAPVPLEIFICEKVKIFHVEAFDYIGGHVEL